MIQVLSHLFHIIDCIVVASRLDAFISDGNNPMGHHRALILESNDFAYCQLVKIFRLHNDIISHPQGGFHTAADHGIPFIPKQPIAFWF